MQNVTKLDLVTDVSKKTKIHAVQVRGAIESFFEIVADHLAQNHRLEIRGFGSLYMKKRKPKLVRNPKKPAETKIMPERWSPVLRYSNELKVAISRPATSGIEKEGDSYFVTVFRDFVDTEIESTTQTMNELIRTGAKKVVLDFGSVRNIYSPGIAALVGFNRQMKEFGGTLFLINLKSGVRNKFESVNLDKALLIYGNKAEFLSQNQPS